MLKTVGFVTVAVLTAAGAVALLGSIAGGLYLYNEKIQELTNLDNAQQS